MEQMRKALEEARAYVARRPLLSAIETSSLLAKIDAALAEQPAAGTVEPVAWLIPFQGGYGFSYPDDKNRDQAFPVYRAPPSPVAEGVGAFDLTPYEVQVLLGTSIHGCRMRSGTAFPLEGAWSHLRELGLIDRADGLAIITPKGESVAARIRSALTVHLSGQLHGPTLEAAAKHCEVRANIVDRDELADRALLLAADAIRSLRPASAPEDGGAK